MKTIQVSLKNMQQSGMSLDDYMEWVAAQVIADAIEDAGENKQQAAFILGMNRTTMLFRMGRSELLKHKILPPRRSTRVN
jgi:DNA-binding NtrC family response regulator